jgi:hypothetical protein
MTDFHPLRRLLVLLLSLFWATMGSAAALAERSDFDHCAIAANNVAVRQHYLKTLEGIPGKIDGSLPIREQALQAFQLRNAAKVQARAMMTDRNAAALLDKTDPIPTLQDVVRKVYDGGRGPVGDDMWRAILASSTRSRSSVNQALGVGN